MNRIFITGDIHGDMDLFRFSSKRFPQGTSLTKDDYVIIAGDFGLLWSNIPDNRELYNIKWLKNKPWTTLFVDGNHENFSRLNNLPTQEIFGGTVGVVEESVYHLKRGQIYTICGKKFFCFGGALSWDIKYRTLGISYWEEEVPNCAEMDFGLRTLESAQYNVDYIVTHTLPKSLIPILGFSKNPDDKIDPTISYLDHIANCATFKNWYFGHMHVNKKLGKFHALFEDIVEITLDVDTLVE